MKRLILLLCCFLLIPYLWAEHFPVPVGKYAPLSYVAHKPISEIVIDGNFDEESWVLAPWTEDFVDIEGDLKPKPFHRTRVKMLWDEDWLYFAAEMEEPHVWATLTERDAVIFHDNDFEIFIDPDGDTHDYYELEINALGTLWDLFLIKPYRDRQQVALNAWDVRDIVYAIGIDGTLNEPSDTDRAWRMEMKIPMAVLAEAAHMPIPPNDGDFWRLNFSRVHWDTEIIDGGYKKIEGKPEYNWVWSPQGLIAMHYPERWGYLFFSHENLTVAEAIKTDPRYQIPETEQVRESLRQIYYLQKQYYMDHGRFASSLRRLKAQPIYWKGRKLPLKYERTRHSWVISSPSRDGLPPFAIREDGLIWSPKR